MEFSGVGVKCAGAALDQVTECRSCVLKCCRVRSRDDPQEVLGVIAGEPLGARAWPQIASRISRHEYSCDPSRAIAIGRD